MPSSGDRLRTAALGVTGARGHGGGRLGETNVLATSAVASLLDLRTLTSGLSYDPGDASKAQGANAPPNGPVGAVGSFITIFADTSDVGYILGTAKADVTGANVPALATNGAVDANGVYTGAAKTCARIPSGQSARFRLQVGVDNFLGFVAAGAGQIRVYISSEPGGAT